MTRYFGIPHITDEMRSKKYSYRPTIPGKYLSMGHRRVFIHLVLVTGWLVFDQIDLCQGAVKLDNLGRYLTGHAYGGAQLVDSGKFYHLPIHSNGHPGHLVVDTGSPATIIFRSSVRRLGLNETRTNAQVRGAFGEGRDTYGLAVINSFIAGNCTLKSVPVAIAPDMRGMNIYGRPNGLLGLRELVKFGAVLDLSRGIVYLRPTRPDREISAGIKSILEANGWRPVPIMLTRNHLRVTAEVNDVPCHLLVDTGAFLTALDRDFAATAKIPVRPTHATATGVGRSGGSVGLATFHSLWVGNYEIKNASASVIAMDSHLLGRGTNAEVAGLLGVEYLARSSAIFDFVSGTLFLRPVAKHHR
ncbi:MAG TPA: aspartyl protease family protein [Chthoniobacterales bacterium]